MSAGSIARETVFSPCRKWRYTLWREFAVPDLFRQLDTGERRNDPRYLMVIGLNPSTADETKDDPTIRRCIDFARRWDFGALCMTNLFAWRETDPRKMMREENPVGEDNQHHLLQCAAGAELVLAAWGKDGRNRNMDLTVFQWLTQIGVKLHWLKRNQDGTPQHPLYVSAHTLPILWTP